MGRVTSTVLANDETIGDGAQRDRGQDEGLHINKVLAMLCMGLVDV